MANPIELDYQTGRSVCCIRVSLSNGKVYNTSSQLYETYNSSNDSLYQINLTETIPSYYRATCPSGSLSLAATEVFYELRNPPTLNILNDAPSIGVGNSQGVNIGTVNGVTTTDGLDVATDIDICNLALTHLGQATITSFSDASENARKCALIYDTCRDELLRSATWKFAARIAALTDITDTTTAPVGWTYVYGYPSDCIYVRKAFIEDTSVFTLPFFVDQINLKTNNPNAVEYKVLYFSDLDALAIVSNESPLYLEYTARVGNSGLYDAKFIKALSYKLAGELADVLTGAQSKGPQMHEMFYRIFSDAAKDNGNENGVDAPRKSAYFDAR